MESSAENVGEKLGNRAITVSVVLAGWELGIREDAPLAEAYGRFVDVFLQHLAEQVERMKQFDPDPRYEYLVTFQRHLTQAAVERPAITYRHETLLEQFAVWRETGGLAGD